MEQLTFFILGVVTVLLILGVVVAVKMTQKNNKVESDLTNLQNSLEINISELRRYVEELDKLVNLRVDRESESINRNIDDIYRAIDSRTDKLATRFENDLKHLQNELSKLDVRFINHKLNS